MSSTDSRTATARVTADRTTLSAIGRLTVAAWQLETLQANALAAHSTENAIAWRGWDEKVRQSLDHFDRIRGSIARARQVGNSVPVQLDNGAVVPADAAYFDRMTDRLAKLHRIGLLHGYSVVASDSASSYATAV
ncbi:hypothetical protein GCM10027515_34190 [Schumannella luteola]|uniref:Uncharacterized protein n=1 Tax=Schumannella luteola TaxID=472059 RepID=A0A852YNN8_9MICO|nr:hypothetical protein [Schumannella luteola]NYH00779.1 hypothetical protein [Schumannella luteola]TPX02291.1 hypothetical protein FJ656_23195 [Schumannella luteola]